MSTLIDCKKIAIYYGYPSGVNGTFSISGAAAVFGQYDLVVWGDTLENPSHPDHANAVAIIADTQMQNTQVFGYIDSVLINSNWSQLQTNIQNWQLMGVKGIFCDRFGYDFLVSRASQNQISDYVHSLGLLMFVNAFHPDDAFSTYQHSTFNPTRIACHINSGDWYLAESYTFSNDVYVEQSMVQSKSTTLQKYQRSLGIKIATITTTASGTFDQQAFDFSYFTTLLFGFNASGWGEQNYSASSGSLPMRSRKTYYGTSYTSDVKNLGDMYQKTVNVGFKVNFTTHTVDTMLI